MDTLMWEVSLWLYYYWYREYMCIAGHESLGQPFERDDSKEFIVNWMDSKPYPLKVL